LCASTAQSRLTARGGEAYICPERKKVLERKRAVLRGTLFPLKRGKGGRTVRRGGKSFPLKLSSNGDWAEMQAFVSKEERRDRPFATRA